MTASAKIRTLQVRPLQSADLSFETAGLLWLQGDRIRLGSEVRAFDLPSFVAGLGTVDSTNDAKLVFDAPKIRSELAPQMLFAQRNDALAVALQQLLVARESAVLQRYRHIAEIARITREVYPADRNDPRGKLAHLREIARLSVEQRDALAAAYAAAGRDPVITKTSSVTTSTGQAISETFTTPVTIKTTAHRIIEPEGVTDVGGTQAIPQRFLDGDWQDLRLQGNGFLSEQTSTNSAGVTQTSETHLVEFRHPAFENQLVNHRTQIGLLEELHACTVFSVQVPEIEKILLNELAALDLAIAQAQLRLLQTFLLTPISGVVTAIYKDVGEMVQAGEPVLRVENRERLLLVGLLRCAVLIRLGASVTIAARPFETADRLTIRGTVAAVRGHESDDDAWDVIIDVADVPALPLNYHFDPDTTEITVD